MAITASMVKELRDATGAGMMDAKKALTETDGDFEAAVDWLRTKGLAKAAKKSGRVAAEGLVAVSVQSGTGVAVEVNSETDFVGKNAEFQTMVGSFAQKALDVADVDALAQADIGGKTVTEVLTDKIATIGENMSLRRMSKISGDSVQSYVHSSAAEGMGRIGVLVATKGVNVLTEQARESGKPEAVIEKMIVGRIKKFLSEVTLLGQAFVINPDLTVEQAAKEAGVEITGYVRMEVGEGIEKKEEDFAAEVAKVVQG